MRYSGGSWTKAVLHEQHSHFATIQLSSESFYLIELEAPFSPWNPSPIWALVTSHSLSSWKLAATAVSAAGADYAYLPAFNRIL